MSPEPERVPASLSSSTSEPVAVPAPPPSSVSGRTTRDRLRSAASRAKLRLLRVRYVLGYLAGSLLVSVPIDLGYHVASGRGEATDFATVGVSIGYGVLCLVGFFALRPITQVPWERVRVPEFAVFEMEVAAWAAAVALGLLAASLSIGLAVRDGTLWLPPRLFWTVFVLVALAWTKLKAQTLVFPEFYADRGGEKILTIAPEPPAGESTPPRG